MLSIKTSFREKIAHLKSAKKMASFLIVENASLATIYPDVCTAVVWNIIFDQVFAERFGERSYVINYFLCCFR